MMGSSKANHVTKHWSHDRVPTLWKERAACHDKDPELWFPETNGLFRYDRTTQEAARAICLQCPVQAQCLEYALVVDIRYGMFGGLSAPERTKITGKR